ncbi:MAG: Fe-S-cluster containining protein [Kiritimatiellia bacterium]|jgi:uncharacterized protein
MIKDYTEALCTQCGLCCDGSIFDDVELASRAEAKKLATLGLEIDADDQPPLLLLPCTALRDKRCSIYQHRPGHCRKFECRLLQDAQEGRIELQAAEQVVETALTQTRDLRALCRDLGGPSEDLPLKMRCVEVLALPIDCADDTANAKRGELVRAMDAMARLLSEHFV